MLQSSKESIYTSPTKLTPMMKKYENKYLKKSKQKESLADNLEGYSVVEWEDGWVQFRNDDDSLFIYTVYFEKDREYKFNYIYKLAKNLKVKKIIFITKRNPEAWIKLLKLSYPNHSPKLEGYLMGVTV